MIKINMFSAADKVKGQGVGSVYDELMAMLKKYFKTDFKVTVNRYTKSDISHYHTINFSFYLSTFSRKRGVKIGMVHFLPETLDDSLKLPRFFKFFFYRYVIAFYKRMDHLVVVNPAFIPKLMAYGIPRDHISYIPNFVSKREFYPVNTKQKMALRRRYGYSTHRFTVLGSGQIQTRKGVLDFIKLARLNPKIQFIWTGGFSFGNLTAGYSQLKRVVENPPRNLSFPGIIDRQQLVDYYDLADLFLLPSYHELFPMSVLEAFSCGDPVLLRNLSLYQAIIKGGYLAFNDFKQLNQVVRNCKGHRYDLKRWRQKSLRMSNHYSEDHLARIWHRFYLSQLKKVR